MKIGQILKTLRVNKGLNQSEIASKIGIAAATYSRYENDQLEPSLDKLLEISIILEEDPSIFFRSEMVKRFQISMKTDTGYSFIFNYWHLKEIAKILNSRRNELTLPEMNKYAKLLQLSFEQVSLASIHLSQLLKPESFDEFLAKNNLDWLVAKDETTK